MQLDDFYYDLPTELIAHYPLPERSASRLLYLNKNTGSIQHLQFINLLDLLTPRDLLVFNNTQVIPARLLGNKASGGKVEVLVERILSAQQVLAHVRASKAPKSGAQLLLQNAIHCTVISREQDLFVIEFDQQHTVLEWLEAYGHIPLPPYINRADEVIDRSRYQTVYAQHKGAVAAPTAGLHFDHAMLEKIKNSNIHTAFITLHVGSGTFQPVRVDNILQHKMHAEFIAVNAQVCATIEQTKLQGGRVIAVGTTTVRALETAAKYGSIKPYQGDTDIFIYPGYKFKCVDALVTNFHLPKSSLLMLVCALGGYELVMNAYQAAAQQHYRFYSYGDAMFIG